MALNRRLFRALEAKFGQGQVRIARQGMEMVSTRTAQLRDGRQIKKLKREASGEEYHLKCPLCKDYKRRLSISYRWGKFDKASASLNLWLMQCWNGNCFDTYEKRRKFYDKLFGDDFSGEKDDLRPVVTERGYTMKTTPKMPGRLWRLDKLLLKAPRHAAIRYAESRLMDVEYIGQTFGVGYCPEPNIFEAENRIIVPIYMHGKLRGWSGRFIGDMHEEENAGEKVPKWYHDNNMQKSEVLYNFDGAQECHTKIVVEGCGDVWGAGACGVGVLGKHISNAQVELLQECCQGDDFAIVVMLDPKQSEVDAKKGMEHHFDVAVRRLRSIDRFKDRVVPVKISNDLDPGDADRGYLYGLIRYVAQREKIKVLLPEV